MPIQGFARWGGLSSIAFAVLALTGLALWFSGSGSPEGTDDISEVADKLNSADRAVAGAWLIVIAMVALVVFACFLLARWGRASGLMIAGAVLLMFAGLVHTVENLLVVGLYGSTVDEGAGDAGPAAEAIWRSISSCSVFAIGLLGAAAIVIGSAFLTELDEPRWLSLWGLATGTAGLLAALSFVYPAVSFLAALFNPSLLAWLITVGVRAARAPYQAPAS
jgi:hypothetical protein